MPLAFLETSSRARIADAKRRAGGRQRRCWGLLLGATWFCLAHAGMAQAGQDPWSLERKDNDTQLVRQRWAKLRKNPFDRAQWRALEQAMGPRAMARRVERELKQRPTDPTLNVLHGRALMSLGQFDEAATALLAVAERPGRLAARALDLWVQAMERAGRPQAAVDYLLSSHARDPKHGSRQLDRAHALADRHQLLGSLHTLAELRLKARPRHAASAVQVARTAARASNQPRAREAFSLARQLTGPSLVLDLEYAEFLLLAADPREATTVLTPWLDAAQQATREQRTRLFRLLLRVHTEGGSTREFAGILGKWLNDERNEHNVEGWRTLALARAAHGGDAETAWRRAVDLSPNRAEIRLALVREIASGGDLHAAANEFQRVPLALDGVVQVGLDLAARLVGSGDTQAGWNLVRYIERGVWNKPDRLAQLLDFYNLQNRPTEAIATARRMLDLRPRDSTAIVALGEQLYQSGDARGALKTWQRLTKAVRPKHRGWAKYAEVMSEHHRWRDADLALERARKAAPDNLSYLRLYALLQQEKGRPVLALDAWEEIYTRATGARQRVQRDEARSRIVEILVGDGMVGPSYRGRGSELKSRLQRTIIHSRDLLERGQPMAQVLSAGLLLAEIYTRREAYAQAVAVHQRLVSLVPDDPERLTELAAAQRRAGETESALSTVEELLALGTKHSADALNQLSELALDRGDGRGAILAAKRAMNSAAGAKDPTPLVNVGHLLRARGDFELAATAYEEALKLVPGHPEVVLHRADLQVLRGQPDQARRALVTLLEAPVPAHLVHDIGLKALALSGPETRGSVLTAVVDRVTAHAHDHEHQRLLLSTLERIPDTELDAWLASESRNVSASDDLGAGLRRQALLRPLMATLRTGTSRARESAASHLGRLADETVALELVKLATYLPVAGDATRTARESATAARVAALVAAAAMDSRATVASIATLVADRRQPATVRHTAAWALFSSQHDAAAHSLARHLHAADVTVAMFACLANFRAAPQDTNRPGVAQMAREHKVAVVRRACALAEAAALPSNRLERLRSQLHAPDPVIAAIAAWRLGTVTGTRREEALTWLLDRFFDAPGLPRDASVSALIASVRPGDELKLPSLAPQSTPTLWGEAVDRWIRHGVSTPRRPLTPKEARTLLPHAQEAITAARAGTRAQQQAAQAAQRGCRGAFAGTPPICLGPLVQMTTGSNSPSR